MRGSKAFWAAAVAGWSVIGVALAGVVRESARTHPADFAKWFLGAGVAHDLVLLPVVLLVGVAVARLVPATVRPIVAAGLFGAAVITLYAVPVLTGEGRRPSNPSALPNDYWAGLGLVLGGLLVVVLVAAAAAVVKTRRHD